MNRQGQYIFPDSFLDRVAMLSRRMNRSASDIIQSAVAEYDPQPVQHLSEPVKPWVWNNQSKPLPELTRGTAK